MRISDWSSDVCSSDLVARRERRSRQRLKGAGDAAGAVAFLDDIPDFRFQAEAIEAVDLLQAGRRGDVDFGHVVADDVDAGKDEPAFLQGRPDGLADLELAARQRSEEHTAVLQSLMSNSYVLKCLKK